MKSIAIHAIAATLFAASIVVAEAPPDARAVVANRAPLAPAAFIKLPIGSVRADGWLLRQLELQKAGLTGSAEQLYDALTPDSGWLGGKGEGWEKGPYYVKGLVALAYTLDDQALKQRAQKWIDWTLNSQKPDGMFGPASNDDWWPRMVVLFYLRDYYEATNDQRVLPFLTNYFRYQLATLPGRPLKDWGKSRAGDNLDVVLWLYNRTADPSLLALAKLLNDQAYAWTSIFTDNRFYAFGDDFQPHHIVNVSQALKTPAVAWQFTHDDADKSAVEAGVANLDRQYGRIDGQVSGTEMLSGLNSTAGVELCADVERIISNGIAIDVLGDPALADRMEQVAYNSLPAHTSPQMRQITYYQLPNQVAATNGGHGFTQDYPNGNMPGPHSGFPCCCYNWHAGWPKLVENLWAATPDGGVAAIAYGPSRVTTTANGDTPITIAEATDYPFDESVTLKVDPAKPATFPLVVRVPGWCETPTIAVNGEAASGVRAGTFHRLAREWKSGDVVTLKFPMTVKASTWANGSVGLTRGPIAFALKVGERWKKTTEFLQNFDEFEVLPTTPWNYALDVDRAHPRVTVNVRPVGDIPFATEAAPVTLSVAARRVPSWGLREQPGTATLGRADHNWQQIADAPTSFAPNVPHHVRIEVKGTSIKAFVDDMAKPTIERDDATFASGGIGLRAYDASARFDDVKLDGTLVDDFAKGAAAWQTLSGKWAVRDGAFAVEPAKDAKAVLKTHRDVKDLTLDATLTLKPGGDAGFLLRVSDANEKLDGYRGYYVGFAAERKMSEDAQEPPPSPVTSDEPTETVELIPFGSAKLRVSYFPTLK